MASATLQAVGQRFPAGTTVGAYPLANWAPHLRPPTGAPVGAATTTATMGTDGKVAFTGLTDNTEYVAYAEVNGEHRYVGFAVRPNAQVTGGTIGAETVTATELAPGSLTAADAAADMATQVEIDAKMGTPAGIGVLRATPAFATTYQPSATRPTFVNAVVQIDCNANDEEGAVEVLISGVDPPVTVHLRCRNRVESDAVSANPRQVIDFPLTFLVPAGFYYRITSIAVAGSPGFNLIQVREFTL